MAKNKKPSVCYYLPKRKRPIAYSNYATSYLISILSEIFYNIQSVKNAIFYDKEAIEILEIYIDKGYGAYKASDFFRDSIETDTLNFAEKPYSVLIANFPFINTIEEAKTYLEYKIINNNRVWEVKKPFIDIIKLYGGEVCAYKD